jgi:hypothetical protein
MKSLKIALSLIAAIGGLALAATAQQTSSLASSAPASTNNAVVPQLVNYSGVLTDGNGKPLTDVVGVTFALYQESEGGTPLWMEIQNVQPAKGGRYTAMLGSTSSTGLPQDVFVTGEARWLGVQAEGQAEAPRVLLVAVPYALKAGDAETIGGLPASAFVLANGTSATAGIAKSAAAPASSGASKNSAPPANPAVTGKGTVDFIPMWDTASDIVDSVIFQKTSEIGIGTTAPAATLDVNGKTDVRDTLTLFPKSNDNALALSGSTFNISSLGKVTFVTGQTFPGAGTITGITTATGSGLSGGGTSGTLSLKVAAAGITNAMLADSKITLNASTAGGLAVPGAMTLGSTYTIGLKTCAANQVLQYSGTVWGCASVGTGTVTSVSSGAGLTGGPITGAGTLSIATGGVSNAMLANSSLKISPGTALTGGGTVALGGSTSLSLDTTKVPLLTAANTFNANQTLNGTLTASSSGLTINATSTSTSDSAVGGTGPNYGVTGLATSTSGIGVSGYELGTTGTTYGVYGADASSAGYGVYGASPYVGVAGNGSSYGVYGSSAGFLSLGVYGTSPYIGVQGNSSATTGGGFGLYGSSASSVGIGVGGTSDWIGVEGYSSGNVGIYGSASGSSLEGSNLGSAGVWGDTGNALYVGLLGTADDSLAGYFANNSSTAATILAENSNSAFGAVAFQAYLADVGTYAIIGDPGCDTGFIALALGQAEMTGCSNYTLTGGTNGHTYLNASSGAAVHLRISSVDQLVATSGNVDILGTLSKGGGSFKIDHPLDPANKYLYHSFVESPDMMNIYNGNVITDANGGAAVDLPEWFETLNRDFRYQLTVIGQFAQAIVAGKVANHQFVIKTDKPNVEVSWQVTGIRQDAFANAHRIQAEVEKAPADRGHYLYPELVGASETARIGYMTPAPGSEQVIHHRRPMLKRGNASPLQRTPPSIPIPPPIPVSPKMPHTAASVGRVAINQK